MFVHLPAISPLIIEFLQLPTGRDKLCRLIQYAAKALNSNPSHLQPTAMTMLLSRLERNMSDARKVWRLFRFLELYEAVRTARGPTPLLRRLKQARLTCHCVYFLSDNILWLAKMDLIMLNQRTKDFLEEIINIMWFLGTILGLLYDALSGTGDALSYVHHLTELRLASSLVFRLAIAERSVALLGLSSSITGIAQVVQKLRSNPNKAHF